LIGVGAEPLKELRIILVDDSLLIQDYMKRVLTAMKGCNLIGTASDGDEALSMIRMLHPDVVLLDVTMPRKNGIEVLKQLRRENSKVIVIMFTADSTPGLMQKCSQEGANYFVDKTEYRRLVEIFADLQKD
jgi:two-component system response regulator DctR